MQVIKRLLGIFSSLVMYKKSSKTSGHRDVIVSRVSGYAIEGGLAKERLDFERYSSFKYGHRPEIELFAQRIVSEFLTNYPIDNIILSDVDFVVTTSPYWHTPPSANALAEYVHFLLNEALYEVGKGAMSFVKIHRSGAPSCDFSALSLEERMENMKADVLSMNCESVRGKRVILVEDARITGSHEEKTLRYLTEAGVEEIIFLYVIDVQNGVSYPDIENKMNHTRIHSLDRLLDLMDDPDQYVINSRVCRFVLSEDDEAKLIEFCKNVPMRILLQLYRASINDGYGIMDAYRDNFRVVRRELQTRQQLEKITFYGDGLEEPVNVVPHPPILISKNGRLVVSVA